MYLFRPITVNDHYPLRLIHHAAFHDVVAQQWGWDDDVQDSMWAEYLAGAEALQVIEIDGEAAGYLDVIHAPDHIFIANIVLDPGTQKRGYGTRILEQIMNDAQNAKLPVKLQVIKANHAAIRLYERLGFGFSGDAGGHREMVWIPKT